MFLFSAFIVLLSIVHCARVQVTGYTQANCDTLVGLFAKALPEDTRLLPQPCQGNGLDYVERIMLRKSNGTVTREDKSRLETAMRSYYNDSGVRNFTVRTQEFCGPHIYLHVVVPMARSCALPTQLGIPRDTFTLVNKCDAANGSFTLYGVLRRIGEAVTSTHRAELRIDLYNKLRKMASKLRVYVRIMETEEIVFLVTGLTNASCDELLQEVQFESYKYPDSPCTPLGHRFELNFYLEKIDGDMTLADAQKVNSSMFNESPESEDLKIEEVHIKELNVQLRILENRILNVNLKGYVWVTCNTVIKRISETTRERQLWIMIRQNVYKCDDTKEYFQTSFSSRQSWCQRMRYELSRILKSASTKFTNLTTSCYSNSRYNVLKDYT